MRSIAAIAVIALAACSAEKKAPAAASAPHGPLAALMTQHDAASCSLSGRTYATIFYHPPYQTCSASSAESTESAEIDADSVVVELYNTWTTTPAAHASLFSQAEGELTGKFGSPQRCSDTKLQWRQGDSLHMVLQIAPVSDVGTEADEGPYRMTRIARLGPLDPGLWGC